LSLDTVAGAVLGSNQLPTFIACLLSLLRLVVPFELATS
jgi:hypothetical protein